MAFIHLNPQTEEGLLRITVSHSVNHGRAAALCLWNASWLVLFQTLVKICACSTIWELVLRTRTWPRCLKHSFSPVGRVLSLTRVPPGDSSKVPFCDRFTKNCFEPPASFQWWAVPGAQYRRGLPPTQLGILNENARWEMGVFPTGPSWGWEGHIVITSTVQVVRAGLEWSCCFFLSSLLDDFILLEPSRTQPSTLFTIALATAENAI